MAAVDLMYRYSLAYFVSLFLRYIEASERSRDVPARLAALKKHFTHFLYTNVCRSLFEAHKLLFAFNLAVKIAAAHGEVEAAHLSFLLTGGIAMATPHANPAEGELTAKAWGELCRLTDLGGAFEGLREAVTEDAAPWVGCALCSTPARAYSPDRAT